jgi:hypothetical protein
MNAEQEQDYRDEAERLKVLDVDQQRQIVELHRRTANDTRATRADRRVAAERADALERFLGLPPGGPQPPDGKGSTA